MSLEDRPSKAISNLTDWLWVIPTRKLDYLRVNIPSARPRLHTLGVFTPILRCLTPLDDSFRGGSHISLESVVRS